MTKPETGPTALDKFLHHKARIDRAIERIKASSDDHFGVNPDDCNWGDVGTLEHMADRIEVVANGISAN